MSFVMYGLQTHTLSHYELPDTYSTSLVIVAWRCKHQDALSVEQQLAEAVTSF